MDKCEICGKREATDDSTYVDISLCEKCAKETKKARDIIISAFNAGFVAGRSKQTAKRSLVAYMTKHG